jgi:hypothetical protein
MLFRKISILVCALVFYAGCNDSSIGSGQTGTLSVRLTDAPGDYEKVNITFSEVSAHIDGDWVTVRNEPLTVDLLEWNNGKSLVLGTAEVPAGKYTQIRLIIDDANVVYKGQTRSVTVPSGAQSGLKLLANFDVLVGSTYEMVVDFDAQRSIVATGPRENPNGFLLKPTVRVAPLAISGSISGTITNPMHQPIAYAIANGDTITSSLANATSGNFTLAFLSEGMYTVAVQDTLNASAIKLGVSVTPGSDFGMGIVILQ